MLDRRKTFQSDNALPVAHRVHHKVARPPRSASRGAGRTVRHIQDREMESAAACNKRGRPHATQGTLAVLRCRNRNGVTPRKREKALRRGRTLRQWTEPG